MVQLGALVPQTEIGRDPGALREFAQGAEQLGFDYITAYEHVVGANIDRPERRGGRWPYTHQSMFHEPMVMLGFLAGVTSRVGFATTILILPQRQTVLLAKQAAEVDLLCGGRFR